MGRTQCRRRYVLLLVVAVAQAVFAAPAATRENGRVGALPADPEQEAALLAALGTGFSIQRTPHFLIAHNVTAEEIKPFGARVEQVYVSIYRFCEFKGVPAGVPERKLEIVFFDTYPEYERYARRTRFPAAGTYGFYHDTENRAAFYNVANGAELVHLRRELQEAEQRAAVMEKRLAQASPAGRGITFKFDDGTSRTLTREQARKELGKTCEQLKRLSARADQYAETINRTVVQHETAHQVFFNAGVLTRGGRNPSWLSEGLATLFETPPTGVGSGIGVINQLRLRDFRAAAGAGTSPYAAPPELALAAMRKGTLAPLDKLLTTPELFGARGPQGAAYYAQAWALVHYFHRTRPKEFAEYLRVIAARPRGRTSTPESEIADFEQVFGKVDDAFVRRWARYILSLPVASP